MIRELRKSLGLRLIDISNATGVREEKIGQWERGVAKLNSVEMIAVRDFFRTRLAGEISRMLEERFLQI